MSQGQGLRRSKSSPGLSSEKNTTHHLVDDRPTFNARLASLIRILIVPQIKQFEPDSRVRVRATFPVQTHHTVTDAAIYKHQSTITSLSTHQTMCYTQIFTEYCANCKVDHDRLLNTYRCLCLERTGSCAKEITIRIRGAANWNGCRHGCMDCWLDSVDARRVARMDRAIRRRRAHRANRANAQ